MDVFRLIVRGPIVMSDLSCEPWGHMNHKDVDCGCLSSYRTGAYVHELSVALPLWDLVSAPGCDLGRPVPCAGGPAPGYAPISSGAMHSVTMRPGLVPYVSHHAGSYSRLLLATYVRWHCYFKCVNTYKFMIYYNAHK